jgi:uncharacterized membrane protein
MNALGAPVLQSLRVLPAPAPAATPRYGFIDLLRGFALVVMIETHVVNAYLPGPLRANAFFSSLTFVNGLVAPAFLFAAGFSVRLQGERVWNDWLRFGPAFWRQARRLGFITLIAYYSHLRGFKFSRYVENEPGIWRETLQVDILQCVVASLLVVHRLWVLLRPRPRGAAGAAVLAAAVALATPWVWAHDLSDRLPIGLALFLSPHGLSYFPRFPWIVYVLVGCVAAHLFLGRGAAGSETGLVRRAAVLAGLAAVAALAARDLPLSLPGLRSFYTTSPLYVIVRLACVVMIGAALFWLERARRFGPGAIRTAGRESLLVYGVHLWLIFAVLRGKHLGPILGLQAGWAVCLAASAAIAAAMLALAGGWHRLKARHPDWTKRGQAAVVVTMIVVFLLRCGAARYSQVMVTPRRPRATRERRALERGVGKKAEPDTLG